MSPVCPAQERSQDSLSFIFCDLPFSCHPWNLLALPRNQPCSPADSRGTDPDGWSCYVRTEELFS